MPNTPDPSVPSFTQAWSEAPQRASAHLQRLMQSWQQVQYRTLQALGQDVGMLADEASRAEGLPDLLELHTAYLAEEWTRLMQVSSQMLGSLLEAQARWTRDLEAGTGAWLRNIMPDLPDAAAPALPAAFSPTGMMQAAQAAQAAWMETTKTLLGAINHDLEMAGEAADTTAEAPAAARRRGAGSRAIAQ
jgi:hypothetical protein